MQPARVLLAVAALAAALSAVWALAGLPWAERDTALVEAWRAYGLVVFAGLIALLARRPNGHRGVWELVIFHKVALTATAAVLASQGGSPTPARWPSLTACWWPCSRAPTCSAAVGEPDDVRARRAAGSPGAEQQPAEQEPPAGLPRHCHAGADHLVPHRTGTGGGGASQTPHRVEIVKGTGRIRDRAETCSAVRAGQPAKP